MLQKQKFLTSAAHETATEARWLAAVLLTPSLLPKQAPPLDFFTTQPHCNLYSAISELCDEGKPWFSQPLLIHRLRSYGYDERDSVLLFMQTLEQAADVATFVRDYETLVARYQQRQRQSSQPQPDFVVPRVEHWLHSGDTVPIDYAAIAAVADAALPCSAPSPFDSFSTAQLQAEVDPPAWLVPNLLVQDQPALIAGPAHSMKSSLAIDLAAALATGGSFLGEFPVARSFRVGIMTGESNRHALNDLTRRWSNAAEVNLSKVDNLVWSLKLPDLTSPPSLNQLRIWIRQHRLEVVIFDPLYLMAPGVNPNNVIAINGLLQQLTTLCRELGVTPIVCHHSSKTIKPGIKELTDLAGAGLQQFAKQWLLINRRQAYQPGSGQHRLWLTSGGNAGHSGQWGVDIEEGAINVPAARIWQPKVQAWEALSTLEADNRQRTTTQQRLRAKIIAAFDLLPEPSTIKSVIRESCKLNGSFSADRFRFAMAKALRIQDLN